MKPKQDEIGWEKEKNILGPNFANTGPRQQNSEKNSKKIQKIKKPISGNISSQNGMRQAEKGRKKTLGPNSTYSGPRQENSEKNSKEMQKILKTFSRHYF